MKIKSKIFYFVIISTLFFNLIHAKEVIDKIAAAVNGEIIMWSELSAKTKLITENLNKEGVDLPPKKILIQQVLNKMILDKIQLQLAKKFAIEADSDSINSAISNLAKTSKLTIAEYKQKVQETGITFEEFREQIKTEITLARLHQREVGGDLRISQAEIEGYLNSPTGQDNSGTEYLLGHILIPIENQSHGSLKNSQTKAERIINDLKQGKEFKQLAATYSAGAQALEGGDLGWRQINEVPNIFVERVVKMNINEVVGPIKTPSGFHIIKLRDKRDGNSKNYQELHLRQIIIKPGEKMSEEEALQKLSSLRELIINGKQEFAKLAREKSEEPSTAEKGGDLGWVNQDVVIPEFWQSVKDLKKGQISKPFKTDLGCHIVQLLNTRDPSNSKDVRQNRAREVLKEQKFNELLEIWLKKIRDEAKVEILL